MATMGLFDDIDRARAITADQMTVTQAQRVDSVVTDPDSGEQRRRTDHAGTVWYGGRPQFRAGRHPLPGDTAAQINSSFWLPDSHVYDGAAGESIQMQATASVQGGLATTAGGNFLILDVSASLGADPHGSGTTLVYVTVNAAASLPFGVAYRVIVICSPEMLRAPAV
jgi:hypothetical protein